jgi:hypothetical protein
MALGLALFFLIGCFVLLFLMRQWLRGQQAPPRIQAAFSLVVILGSLLGVWLSLRLEYQAGPQLRFAGAPLPLVVFKNEGGQWVDFVHPRPVMAFLLMANCALCAATLAGPLVLWQALRRRSTPPVP